MNKSLKTALVFAINCVFLETAWAAVAMQMLKKSAGENEDFFLQMCGKINIHLWSAGVTWLVQKQFGTN
jgi:hypothetical protein